MKFLLYISYDYGFPIVRPLQEEILKRGYQVAWFVEVEESKKKIQPTENLLNTVEDVLNYKADVNLVACNEVPHFFPGIKVQVFHGIDFDKRGTGNKGHFNIRGFFDLYCTRGPASSVRFKELEKKLKHFKVVQTGWSKLDPLFPIQNKINEKPVIFIASTFTKSMSLAHNKDVFVEIKRLIKQNKWNWLITLHPKMDEKIVEMFRSLEIEANVKYIPALDNFKILKEADVMFSDTSSILIEFIVQKKPVVTFNNKNPKKHIINITEATDIEKSIEFALKRPKDLMAKIDEYINYIHPYSDGQSSKRVIDAVKLFLNNNELENLKSKPINLIRKFKIRKKLKYFNLFKK